MSVSLKGWLLASFRGRIAAAALVLTLGPLVLGGGGAFLFARGLLQEGLERQLEGTAGLAAERLQFHLDELVADLNSLAANTLVANGLVDSDERSNYLEPFFNEHRVAAGAVRLCLLDFRGQPVTCNSARGAPLPAESGWWQSVLHKSHPHVAVRPLHDAPELLIALPVLFRSTGLTEGILTAQVPLGRLFGDAMSPLAPGLVAGLRHGGGMVICRGCDAEDGPLLEVSRPLQLAGLLHGLDLRLTVGQPESRLYAPLTRFGLQFGVLALLVLLLVVAAVMALSARLARPLLALADAAERVARDGGYSLSGVPADRTDELGLLARAIGHMLDRLRVSHATLEEQVAERTAELRSKQHDYRVIFESVHAMIWYLAPDGRVLRANRRAAEQIGMGEAALIGRTVSELFPADVAEQWRIANLEVVRSGEARLGSVEQWSLAHGERGWVLVDRVPLIDGEGLVTGVILLVNDISRLRETEEALARSEERYRVLVEESSDAILVEREGRVVYANPESARLMDCADPMVLFGRWLAELIGSEGPELMARLATLDSGKRLPPMELTLRRPNGETAEIEVTAIALPPGESRQVIIRDISARKRAEERMRFAAAVFENTREGILITDARKRIVAVNRAFTQITGYSAEEALGNSPQLLQSGRQSESFYSRMWASLTGRGEWHGEVWNRRRDGSVFPEWLSISAVNDGRGELTHYVAVFSDITPIKEAERRLETLAYYDPLTELPNRALFHERLHQALRKRRRVERPLALFFIDLDRFKLVNDTLGHEAGDLLLRSVADRVSACVREVDTVARLGGDEFTVVLDEPGSPKEVSAVAQRILAALARPFNLGGREMGSGASIGVALYPQDGGTPEELLKHADAAMYRAKSSGRNTFAFYAPELGSAAAARLQLEVDLRGALERGELRVHYQPQVELASGRVVGAEALVRWDHPRRGMIGPGEFLPAAEESGLIHEIDRWVLGTVCRDYAAMRGNVRPGLRFAVNFSGRALQRQETAGLVAGLLADHGLDGQWLEMELTEHTLVEESETLEQTLAALKGLGVSIAIDDFGTGYSALGYLKRFPVDALKIDRSFVSDLPHEPNCVSIVHAVLQLAESLKLRVVAEGVEEAVQATFLRDHGCGEAQGWFFGRPMAPSQFTELVRDPAACRARAGQD